MTTTERTCQGFIPSWEWDALTPEEQDALIPQAEDPELLPEPAHTSLGRGRTAAWDESLHPRDERGRFGEGTGGAKSPVETLPMFAGSVAEPVKVLADGKAQYLAEHGLTSSGTDFAAVMVDPHMQHDLAAAYDAMPMSDPASFAAYDQLAAQTHEQYQFLTNDLGVQVEFVDHDPYTNAAEMRADLTDNNRLQVLRTSATGSHAYLTDQANDEFRAVHDAFGHAAIGRGFDRNGEEAAFQSHSEMFTGDAIRALATETRGQNAVLITTGAFPPQKVGLLPAGMEAVSANQPMARAAAALDADDDNLYDLTGVHHTSIGRRLPRAQTAAGVWDESLHPRDERGRFGQGTGVPGAGRVIEDRLGDLMARVAEPDGGVSIDVRTGAEDLTPGDGFVGRPDRSKAVPAAEFLGSREAARAALRDFVRANLAAWQETPPPMLGLWHNPTTGNVVLDVADVRPRDEAIRLGRERDQISVWVNGEGIIPTGGSGGRESAVAAGSDPGGPVVDPAERGRDDRRRTRRVPRSDPRPARGTSGLTAAAWDESLHPRDEHGRFGQGTGEPVATPAAPDVKAQLQEIFPDAQIYIDDRTSAAMSDPAVAQSTDGMVKAARSLAEEYPDVAAGLGAVIFGDTKQDGTLGEFRPQGGPERTDGSHGEFQNGEFVQTPYHTPTMRVDPVRTAEAVDVGRLVEGRQPGGAGPVDRGRLGEGVFTHEFGHAVDYASYMAGRSATSLWADHVPEMMDPGPRHISDYAMVNAHEYFAEAFTADRLGFADRLDDQDRAMLDGSGVHVRTADVAVDDGPPPDTFEGSIIWDYAAEPRTAAAWDESLHPRDEHGRFGQGTGTATVAAPSASQVHDALVPWVTSLFESGKIRTRAEEADAKGRVPGGVAGVLVRAVDTSPPLDRPTYRGVALSKADADALTTGSPVRFSLTSASFDYQQGAFYAMAKAADDVNLVDPTMTLFEINPGGHGLPVEYTGELKHGLDYEQEAILRGDYTVSDVGHVTAPNYGDMLKVTLTPDPVVAAAGFVVGTRILSMPSFAELRGSEQAAICGPLDIDSEIPEARRAYAPDQERDEGGRFADEGAAGRSTGGKADKGARAPGTVTKKGVIVGDGKVVKIGDKVAVSREQGQLGDRFRSTAYGKVTSVDKAGAVGVKIKGEHGRRYYDPADVSTGPVDLKRDAEAAVESFILNGKELETMAELGLGGEARAPSALGEDLGKGAGKGALGDLAKAFGGSMTAGTWDEAQHPRDEHGRFGQGTGTALVDHPPDLAARLDAWSAHHPPGTMYSAMPADALARARETGMLDHENGTFGFWASNSAMPEYLRDPGAVLVAFTGAKPIQGGSHGDFKVAPVPVENVIDVYGDDPGERVAAIRSWARAATFDESLHPRDERGRFGEGTGGTDTLTKPDAQVLPDIPSNKEWAAFGQARADEHTGEAYQHADELMYSVYPEASEETLREIAAEGFRPGSAMALSDASAEYQAAFQTASDIYEAAQVLQGLEDPHDGEHYLNDSDYANARELMNAMAGKFEDASGAPASPYTFGGAEPLRVVTMGTDDELLRGVGDRGGLVDSFKAAMESGETVDWPMASFAWGGNFDEFTAAYEDDVGAPYGASLNASALRYATGEATDESLDPVFITLQGQTVGALVVDGAYEVLTGGKFKVTDVHEEQIPTANDDPYNIRDEELDNWQLDETDANGDLVTDAFGDPIPLDVPVYIGPTTTVTRVVMQQVEGPKPV